MATVKRQRKPNFSSSERIALIEEYQSRKNTLQQKFKTSLTNQKKQKAWEEVTAGVNAVSMVVRTVAEVKEKWLKLSSEAREQLRARKFPPTGSGKAVEMPELDLFEPLFQNSNLIEGISPECGGFDAGDKSPPSRAPSSTSERAVVTERDCEIITDERGPAVAEQKSVIELITDEQSILHLAGRHDLVTGLFERRSPTPVSSTNEPRTAAPSNHPSTSRKTAQKRALAAQDSQTQEELYNKYLQISTELKQSLNRKLATENDDSGFDLDKEKKQLEVQNLREALELKEIEKVHAAEVFKLKKEKLTLQIQFLKHKLQKSSD